MRELTHLAALLVGSSLLPKRVVPSHWHTAFLAGTAVEYSGLSRLHPLLGGDAGAFQELTLPNEGAAWQPADPKTESHDHVARLWLSPAGDRLVRHEPDLDVCLYACAVEHCLPRLDGLYWLDAGGALAPGGFEQDEPSPLSAELKANYASSMMRLCDHDRLSSEIRHAIDELKRRNSGTSAAPGYRHLCQLLHVARLLRLPPAPIQTILQFVNEVQFWPEGTERRIWSDALLSQHDARCDDIYSTSRTRLDLALSAIEARLRAGGGMA